ncbi:response regulator [Marivibrio halodurans]|uniref:histidine kinase n=1 Tax=Marivibrio halodurans TaxID=2039722 RepID=A0A8J7SKS8_9PROT|nr:ATP-binding protein [Marivibrio halodurans]MBP5858668.1 response regulator [Marivibrio halodurans]
MTDKTTGYPKNIYPALAIGVSFAVAMTLAGLVGGIGKGGVGERAGAWIDVLSGFIASHSVLRDGLLGLMVLVLFGVVVFLLHRIDRMHRLHQGALAHVEALYENSPDGTISVDAEGRILRCNDATVAMLGYPRRELIGRPVDSLVPAEARGRHEGLRRGFFAGSENRLMRPEKPVVALARDGRRLPVDISLCRARTPDGEVVIATMRDVSQQQRMVERLTEATRAAEIANRTKSDFLTSVSREIRAPLNGVLDMMTLIEREPLSRSVREKVRSAEESGAFLLALINQLEDFAAIEAGHVEMREEAFDLTAMLDGLHAMFSPPAREKGLNLDIRAVPSDPPTLIGDYTHIRQVIFNLLGNAVKFTDTGSVRLETTLSLSDGADAGMLSCTVRDSGPGIAAGAVNTIFERFAQTEEGRKRGGTGLGLSISRDLAERMGGHLTVTSTPGVGSLFTLTLPIRRANGSALRPVDGETDAKPEAPSTSPSTSPNTSPTTSPVDSCARPLRILVAEDNSVNQVVIASILRREGHDVEVVNDGRLALDRVGAAEAGDESGLDILLMDIRMAEMDGLAATRAIRGIGVPAERLPIIGLTGQDDPDAHARYVEAGMQDVLTKPLRVADLREAIARNMPAAVPSMHVASGRDAEDAATLIDRNIVDQLIETLPTDRMRALMARLGGETDRLAAILRAPESDLGARRAAAHELRGMLGNYGLDAAALCAARFERVGMSRNEREKEAARLVMLALRGITAIEALLDAPADASTGSAR